MPTSENIQAALNAGYTPEQIKLALLQSGKGVTPPPSLSGFMRNVAGSTGNLVGGVIDSVKHPVRTVKTLGKIGVGAIQLADPGDAFGSSYEQNARDFGKSYDNRYGVSNVFKGDFKGAAKKIGNTVYNDPAGTAADVSSVLGGAGAVASGAGKAGKIGSLSRLGRGLSTAAEFVDPLSVTGKLRPFVSNPEERALLSMSKSLDTNAENLVTRGIGTPKQLRKASGVSGMTAGELLMKHNVFDKSPETIQTALDTLDEQKSALIPKDTVFTSEQVLQAFQPRIQKLIDDEPFSKDAGLALSELTDRLRMLPENMTFDQFSKIKKLWGKETNFDASRPAGSTLGRKEAYQGMIDLESQINKKTRQMGREQSGLIKLKDAAQGAKDRGSTRNILSLPKVGAMAAGGSIHGLPGALAGAAIETIANNPRVTGFLAQGAADASKGFKAAAPLMQEFSNKTRPVMGTIRTTYPALTYRPPSTEKETATSSTGAVLPKVQKSEEQTELLKKEAELSPSLNDIPTSKDSQKALRYKPAKNVFSNKSSFGKTVKLKRGSFY